MRWEGHRIVRQDRDPGAAQGLGWVSRNVHNKPVGQTPSRGGGGAGLGPARNVFDQVRS